jgi:hypothetical protein
MARFNLFFPPPRQLKLSQRPTDVFSFFHYQFRIMNCADRKNRPTTANIIINATLFSVLLFISS